MDLKISVRLGGTAALTLAVLIAGPMGPASAAEKTITAASCFPIGAPPGMPFEKVVEEINARGAGVLKIDLKGGAPAIGSPFTLTQKMAQGAYDMVGCTEAYFGNVLPEAPVLRFSEHSYGDLRKNGAIDYMEKLFNGKNLHYVGRHHTFGPFHLYTNNKIDKADLTGMNLRVSPVYTAFFKSLGATVQTTTMAQVYTFMENNTVQGYGWPLGGYPPPWAKVTKYRVDPGFYDSALHTLVNLRTWNGLEQPQKDLINQVVMEFEQRTDPFSAEFAVQAEKYRKFLSDNGVETIELQGAERDKWVNGARESGWAEVKERSPDHYEKLRGLFTK